MGPDFDPMEIRPGAPILARWARWVSGMILVTVRFHAPLRATRGGGGRWLDVRLDDLEATSVVRCQIGTGGMSGRVGTTMGTGTIHLLRRNATTGVLESYRTVTDALCMRAGGFAGNLYGYAALMADGKYDVISVDC